MDIGEFHTMPGDQSAAATTFEPGSHDIGRFQMMPVQAIGR